MNPTSGRIDRRFLAAGRGVVRRCAPALLAVTVLTGVASAPAAAHVTTIKKPDAPTAVTAVAVDDGAAVSWTAPDADGGSPITSYTVTASPGGRTCRTTGATTCTVTGLADVRSYALHVRASTIAGRGRASTVRLSLLPTVSFASSTSFTYPAEQAIVTLSETSSATVRVNFATTGGPGAQLNWAAWSGDAGAFHPGSGAVTFAPGETTASLPFTVSPTAASGCSVQSMELGLPCYPVVAVTLGNPKHALLGPTPTSDLYYGP